MSTVALTKPRTLTHDSAMRIINSARTDWRTWLTACLFPCKLYVALAFLWIVKLKADLPEGNSFLTLYLETGVRFISESVAFGYFLCVAVLAIGTLIQLYIESYRAALVNTLFAVAALVIGMMIMHFAAGLGMREVAERIGVY